MTLPREESRQHCDLLGRVLLTGSCTGVALGLTAALLCWWTGSRPESPWTLLPAACEASEVSVGWWLGRLGTWILIATPVAMLITLVVQAGVARRWTRMAKGIALLLLTVAGFFVAGWLHPLP